MGADIRSANSSAQQALFAMAIRNSDRAILPLNDAAIDNCEAKPAFFCIHSLSGTAGSDFYDLAQRLNPTVRFYGIQVPPKKFRDPEFGGSVESIALYYADALVEFWPSGVFALGGWSVGAVIALEVAHILRGRGRQVELLAAIDEAPENNDFGLSRWDPRYLCELVYNWPRWLLHTFVAKRASWRALPQYLAKPLSGTGIRSVILTHEDKSRPHPVEQYGDYPKYPKNIQNFMIRLYDAALRYQPQKYTGEVVVYEAKIKHPIYLPQVGRIWKKIATRATVVGVPGTHLNLIKEPYVALLSRDLESRVLSINF